MARDRGPEKGFMATEEGRLMQESRREFLRQAAAAGIVTAAGPGIASRAFGQSVPKVTPISMVINQSPWFSAFSALVEQYESETGNRIEFDVNPYTGALEKVRNSLRAADGQYDLLAIDNNWMVEMFAGGFLAPIDELDPAYALDPAVITYDGTIFWNGETRRFDPNGGRLMGVPINGNVEVLFYRADLYEEHGLKVPETWEQLLENVVALNDPPQTYGFVHRDDRTSATADFSNYMFSFGGSVFADRSAGDYHVTFNSPTNLEALEFYLEIGEKGGYPSPGSVSQAQMIQHLLTGKAAHAIGIVGAWADVDDPQKSAVVGKLNAALIPRASREGGRHASRAGHWIGAIAGNVPKERQEAALTFLNWVIARERQVRFTAAGGVPTRTDVVGPELAQEPRHRFLEALAENSKVATMVYTVPEARQLFAITDLRLNEAIIGALSPADALNTAAAEIEEVMRNAGYETGRLPDLG
jgi:multiple sugar transport system substrate-binding protein